MYFNKMDGGRIKMKIIFCVVFVVLIIIATLVLLYCDTRRFSDSITTYYFIADEFVKMYNDIWPKIENNDNSECEDIQWNGLVFNYSFKRNNYKDFLDKMKESMSLVEEAYDEISKKWEFLDEETHNQIIRKNNEVIKVTQKIRIAIWQNS